MKKMDSASQKNVGKTDVPGPSDQPEKPNRPFDPVRSRSQERSRELDKEGRFARLAKDALRINDYHRLSQSAKKLVEKYMQVRDSIIARYESEGLRNVPVSKRGERLVKHQRETLGEKITEAQKDSINSYTIYEHEYINNFCRIGAESMKEAILESIRQKGTRFDTALNEAFDKRLGRIAGAREIAHHLLVNDRLFHETKEHIGHLETIFPGNDIPENMVVKKNIVLDRIMPFLRNKDTGQLQETLAEGSYWLDEGFVSTSLDHNYALSNILSGPKGKELVQMYIKTPEGSKGAYIDKHSSYHAMGQREYELLLPRCPPIQFDPITHLDKSKLSLEEQWTLRHLPSYVIEASYKESIPEPIVTALRKEREEREERWRNL